MNTVHPARPQPPDEQEWDPKQMQSAIAARNWAKVYTLLQKIGYSQQRIARLTGQSQPEVSAIIYGRRVMAYDVTRRIVTGLEIPPCLAGIATCCDCCPHDKTATLPLVPEIVWSDGRTIQPDIAIGPSNPIMGR